MISPLHEIIVTPETVPAYVVIHDASMAFTNNSIPHWHEELELICTLDSRLHVHMNQKDFFINENDLIVVECGQVHTSIPIRGHANRCISVAYRQDFLQKYGIEPNQYHFSLQDNQEKKAEIIQCMEKLDLLYRTPAKEDAPHRDLMANAYLYTIAYLLFSCSQQTYITEPKNHTLKYRKRYCSILSYMQEHYTEPLTLNDVAKHSGLSREHLSREFKTYVGEGFREHLTNIRLVRAQEDLVNSDLPLIELAIKHGFTDLRSYDRAFKKHFGMSPVQYRRKEKRKTLA